MWLGFHVIALVLPTGRYLLEQKRAFTLPAVLVLVASEYFLLCHVDTT